MVFFLSILFTNCEEVVDVALDTAPPKLVVEAAINWEKGTTGEQQTIKLTTTTDYFENKISTVSGATIFVKNSTNEQFDFIEEAKTGRYVCSDFKPVINETYTLTIISNGSTYTATETLKSVAPITKIEQNDQGGFAGEDIEIKTFFNDPANETNYYLYKYLYSNKLKSNYYADEDKFFEGNEFFSISDDEDLKTNDVIEVTHFGISKQYYNYMTILLSVAGSNFGGPFQSPPTSVKGNIINTTDQANYPLGYFSLSEIDVEKFIIK